MRNKGSPARNRDRARQGITGSETGRPRWPARYAPIAVIASLGLIASVSIFFLFRSAEHARISAAIERRGNGYSAALQARLDYTLEMVESVRALYTATDNVTQDEFVVFATNVLKGHQQVQALEWIPRVPDEGRTAYEEDARNARLPAFAITERAGDGSFQIAQQRAEYFPVNFVHPLQGNEAAVGFDLASSQSRKEALQQARDTGSPVATESTTLVQERGSQRGFLVFVPVYRHGATLDSVEQRRESLVGFASGVFRVGDVVEAAVRRLPRDAFDIYVQETGDPQGEQLLYSRGATPSVPPPPPPEAKQGHTVAGMSTLTTIDLPGRQWQLRLVPSAQLIDSLSTSRPWEGLTIGLGLALAASCFLYWRTRQAMRVESLAQGLSLANAALQEDIAHRQTAERETAVRGKRLESLQRLSHAMAGAAGLEAVARLALEEVHRAFADPDSTVGIALTDEWGQQVRVIAALGPRSKDWEGFVLPLGQLRPAGARGVFEDQRPYLQADIQNSSAALRDVPGLAQHRSFIAAPLVSKDRVIGVLFLALKNLDIPAPEEVAFLETCVREIALGIHDAQLFSRTDAALRRRVNEQEALMAVISAATRSLDLEPVLKDVLKRAALALDVDAAGIGLLDETGTRLTVQAAYEKNSDLFRATGVDLAVAALPSLKRVIGTGLPLAIPDTAMLPAGEEKDFAAQWRARSALVLPMLLAGRTLGTLQFTTSAAPRAYTDADILLAQAMGNHLATVVENARLHQRTETERNTLASILASMGEGLVVVDASRKILYFNRAAEEILNLRAQDVVGKQVETFRNVLWPRVADAEKLRADWRGALARVGDTPRLTFETVSGSVKRTIDSILFEARDGSGRRGIGVLLRDITRERQVDRMKSEFISIVSHELRTPMTMILGFTELILLRATNLTENERAWVGEVHRESNRLTTIVEDLLNVSRIEAGTLALEMSQVALRPVAEAVIVRMQRVYPSHPFSVDLPGGVVDVRADPGKVEQVLTNLLDNAAKYSPQGGPVRLSAHFEQDTGMVVVSVSDKGVGIPAEEIPKLFTRFYRAHRPDISEIRGTGLGLNIAKSLLEMMEGRIWVESEEGKGSVFHFSLQAARRGL